MPIRLLGAQVIKIVMLPDIKERMAVLGFEPVPGESFSKSGRKLPNGQKLSERPFRETAGPSRNSDFMSTRPRWGAGGRSRAALGVALYKTLCAALYKFLQSDACTNRRNV
jgi:hypothetical protein